MRYVKALDQIDRFATADWGPFVRYLEIADDGFATRQADLYTNGYGLRYDREQWFDPFGQLGDARHTPTFDSPERSGSTVLEINAGEFESAWEAAARAPNQPQHYDASSFADVPARLGPLTPEHLSRLPPWIARLCNSGT